MFGWWSIHINIFFFSCLIKFHFLTHAFMNVNMFCCWCMCADVHECDWFRTLWDFYSYSYIHISIQTFVKMDMPIMKRTLWDVCISERWKDWGIRRNCKSKSKRIWRKTPGQSEWYPLISFLHVIRSMCRLHVYTYMYIYIKYIIYACVIFLPPTCV